MICSYLYPKLKQHFGKQAENSFQKRNPSHPCIRAMLTKVFTVWHLNFSPFLYYRDVLWWWYDDSVMFVYLRNANVALLCSPFLFLCNLSITDNKWHLNSPQGSTASCQKENAVQSMKESMCKGLCEQHNSVLKASVLFVHVWENTRKCVCVHLCGLVCGRDLLTLTFILHAS